MPSNNTMNRENYLKFTGFLSQVFHKKFGNVWWYSLLHEKNSSKSNLIHKVWKDLPPDPYSIWQSLYSALRKFIVYFARYFIFKFKREAKLKKNVFFSYYGNYFSVLYNLPDSSVVILPQKTDWKEVWKDKEVLALDQFLSIKDFWYVFRDYFKTLWRFAASYNKLKYGINICACIYFDRRIGWLLFKEEVLKSFAGDVLVEGLFFEKIFHRLFLQNRETLKKLIYVHEGQAWEKALLLKAEHQEVIGVLCTLPSPNVMNFWYHKDEVKIMPYPRKLGVIGLNSFADFSRMYGDRVVFILGTTRHQHLKDVENSKGHSTLVILGYNSDENEELLDYLEDVDKGYIIRQHPKFKSKEIEYESLDCVLRSANKVYMHSDSMTSFEAFAMGIEVVIPELENFADLNPLPEDFRGYAGSNKTGDRFNYISPYFTFNTDKEMIKLIEEI